MISERNAMRQDGNALVLAVLILLALTSVGVVSIQRTNMDLLVAGNVVRDMQGEIASEAGTAHGLDAVGSKPVLFSAVLDAQRRIALGETVADADNVAASMALSKRVIAVSTAQPDPAGTGQASFMPCIEGDSPICRKSQDLAYDLSLTYLGSGHGMIGYDVDADICQHTFEFDGRGGAPSGPEPVDATLPPGGACPASGDSAIIRTRARGVTGPVRCPRK